MSFYNLSTGEKATGSEEAAHITIGTIVPDNTFALAKIASIKLRDLEFGKFYEINWELTTTDYKGIIVTQKLKCFDESKPLATDRAIQMLVRLMKLCNYAPPHSGAPSENEMQPLLGRKLGIKIQQWFYNEKEGNFVSELHLTDGFETKEGVLKTAPAAKKEATNDLNDYDKMPNSNNTFDDEIPF